MAAANIGDGNAVTIQWYTTADGDVAVSAPTGITASASYLAYQQTTITVNADDTSVAGSYYFKVTIYGVTSAVATVVVSG